MKVHHSLSSAYNSLLQNQQPDTDSGDGTPFLLPDDDDGQTTNSPSITSSGIPLSISSGFWLNQSGASTDGDTTDGTDPSGDTASDAISAEFAKLSTMTPAEKIRAQYLEAHHLTEEQFSQLPADEQKAINDQIAREIKQKLGAGDTTTDETDSAAAALTLA